jgi:hypothetical protein
MQKIIKTNSWLIKMLFLFSGLFLPKLFLVFFGFPLRLSIGSLNLEFFEGVMIPIIVIYILFSSPKGVFKYKDAIYIRFYKLFLFFCLVSLLYSSWKGAGIISLVKYTMLYLFYLIGRTEYQDSKQSILKYLSYLNISGYISIILGLLLLIFGLEHLFMGYRFSGALGGAPLFGCYMAFLSLFNYIYNKKIQIPFIIFSIALFSSISRTAIIVYFIVLFFIFVLKRLKERNLSIKPIIMFIILIFVFFMIPAKYNRLKGNILQSGTFVGRTVHWKWATQIIKEQPVLGKGLGYTKDLLSFGYNMEATGSGDMHQEYLKVFMESGFFAFICLIFSLLMALKNKISLFFKTDDKTQENNSLLLASFIISSATIMGADNYFSMYIHIGFLYFYLLGVSDKNISLSKNKEIDSNQKIY